MKNSLSSLNFILKADITQFQKSLRAASTELKRTGDKMKAVGGSMSLYLTTPIAAATTAMMVLTNRSAEFADNIEEMSQRTGVSVKSLQELNYVANQAGMDFNALEGSLAKLTKSMGAAASGEDKQSKAFQELGVNILDSEGNLRSISDVFPEVIGALSEMSNETERNVVTMQLFGRSATEIINPLTELGEQGIRELIDRAHELGIVMSDEGISSLAEYKDAMDSVKDQVAAVGRELSMSFAKVMTDTIIPMLQNEVVPAVRAVAKWFNDLSPGVKYAVMNFGLFAAAIGPVVLAFGVLTSNVIPAFIAVIRAAGTAYTFLTGVIASNPIGAFAVFITAAATAMGLFSRRTREATDEQKKLGDQLKDTNMELGRQVWASMGGDTAAKAADGTWSMVDAFSGLQDKLKSLNKGELEALKYYLENTYSAATREAANNTNDLASSMAQWEAVQADKALAMVDEELKKFGVTTTTVTPEVKTLEDEIGILEDKLWKEVQANDANATSTARLLDQKRKELDLLREKYQLMQDMSITRMDPLASTGVDASMTMGPPESDLMFARETEAIENFKVVLVSLIDVSEQVKTAIGNAMQELGVLMGETISGLITGTVKASDLFDSIVNIIAGFLRALGESLLAAGIASEAFQMLLDSPAAAIVAGIALIALSGIVSSLLSSGPSGSSAGAYESGPSSQFYVPGAAEGAVVTKPTLLIAGEGGEDEAIIPISTLMDTVYGAISNAGNTHEMNPIPVAVKVQVEGRIRQGEMYLFNKTYSTKITDLKGV